MEPVEVVDQGTNEPGARAHIPVGVLSGLRCVTNEYVGFR